MKMSTKVVIFLLILSFSVALLPSCHSAKKLDEFKMPKEFDEDRQYEITFWSKNDNNLTQKDIYQKAVDDFEKLYPNINVTIRSFYNYGDIYKEVLTNLQTGTSPNVCITYPDHIATYKTGINTVVPLDSLIDDPKYGLGGSELRFDSPTREEIIPKFLEEGKIDGEQYALPFMRSTEACYINADLVEALGFTIPEKLTWEFIFKVSNAAMQPVDTNDEGKPVYINGQTVMIPFVYKSTDNMMIQMLKQKGYEYSDDDGNVKIFNDRTKEILYLIAENVESGAFSTFDIANAYPGDLINSGKCIFGIDSTAGATWMGSQAPNHDIDADSITDFRMVVTEIPQFYPDDPKMISQGPSICIFNKEDEGEVLASWLFAQYLLTNDVQIAYSQTEGYAPVTSKAQNAPEYIDYLSRSGEDNELYYSIKIDATKLLLRNIDNTFITPVFNGSASLRNAAGSLIEETGKSVRRGMKIDDARLEAIFTRMKSLYKLNEDGAQTDAKMPAVSVALLCTLGMIWLGMGSYLLVGYVKKRKKHTKN